MTELDQLRAALEAARTDWIAAREKRRAQGEWNYDCPFWRAAHDAEGAAEARMVGARDTLIEKEVEGLSFLQLLEAIIAGRGNEEAAVGFGYAVGHLEGYAIAELAMRLEGMSAHERIRLSVAR